MFRYFFLADFKRGFLFFTIFRVFCKVFGRCHAEHGAERKIAVFLIHHSVCQNNGSYFNSAGSFYDNARSLRKGQSFRIKIINLAYSFETYTDYFYHKYLISILSLCTF